MIIIVIDLNTYAKMNDLDLKQIEKKYAKIKSSGIIATDLKKFEKRRKGKGKK